MKNAYLKAFTLTEVLITLGIIGIVASLTLPSAIVNYKKQATVAKLKKAYNILNQAYQISEEENGSADNWNIAEINTLNVQKYVHKYWLPYLKVIEECSQHGSCSYPTPVWLNGSKDVTPKLVGNNRYTLILEDGTLVAFVPFVWDGKNQIINGTQTIYVDLNGAKNPNTFGIDIFCLYVIPSKGRLLFDAEQSINKINTLCNKNSNGLACGAKILHDNWQIKEDYPWK